MTPRIETLANGLRIVTEVQQHARSTALGLWLVQGSRHEAESEAGMTHFCEHLLFKGTGDLHWRDIARRINIMGGHFNAVTCPDWVKVYGHVIRKDLPDALRLLAAMMTRSAFPAPEVERERNVILEEIAMYEDMPDDLCQEHFTRALMLPHPLGRPVIGSEQSVASFSRDMLADYWSRVLNPADMILSVAGDFDHDEVVRLAEEELGRLTPRAFSKTGLEPLLTHPRHSLLDRELEQVNFSFGFAGPSCQSPDRFIWAVYDTILGGGMGSRLFDEVREKRGLAYGIGSSINALDRAGYISVGGSTRPESAALALDVCMEEIAKLAAEGPNESELATAIQLIERSITIGQDSLGGRASTNGERLVYGIDYLSMEEVLERYASITPDDVQRVARQVLNAGPPAVCLVGPLEEAKGIEETLARMAKPLASCA